MLEGKWDDAEVIDLFTQVEKVKIENKSIKTAFMLHADKYTRMPNSVRNYYYHEIDDLLKNKNRAKKLNINLSMHQKQEIQFFDKKESEKIITEIKNLLQQGKSVRQACLKLSGGNVSLMLRYQNKYRNYMLKSKENDFEKIEKPINVIEFKNHQKGLTESDINSLFLGLVKLVKKTAIEEVSETLKDEKEKISFLLKKTLIDLDKKEREFNILKEDFLKLKQENLNLINKNQATKMMRARILVDKLAKYRVGKELVK